MSDLYGIINKAVSGFYYVKTVDETSRADLSQVSTIRCVAKGRFRHAGDTPLVGDMVKFTVTQQGNGILTEIMPRKNAFERPPVANIDKIIIVASMANPVTDAYLIDKLTVIAKSKDCIPIICINKVDIADADNLFNIYATTGFPVVTTSAVTGAGIDDLVTQITSNTFGNNTAYNAGTDTGTSTAMTICAFCGNSGVGKSSILNAIDPGFSIKTGDVSRKLGRGRHTTRHIELFMLSNGIVAADTPGFSAFDVDFITEKENMDMLFPEFAPYAGMCRFDDCAHINEPGCAVIDAARSGKIHQLRHDSYKRLYNQAAEYKAWENRK